jgi:hypothetical protein
MDICDVCKTIKLEDLPHEEDPGIPHHASLADLEASAECCSFCKVIFLSVAELATVILNDGNAAKTNEMFSEFASALENPPTVINFTGFKPQSPYGEEMLFKSADGQFKYKRYAGYYGFDDGLFSGPPGYKGPVYSQPSAAFENADKLRPYVFGNWWKSATDGCDQLIGLGVRVGTSPRPEDAVGNREDMVHMRGSSFRFRTGHGKFLLGCSPDRYIYRAVRSLTIMSTASLLASLIPGRLRCTNASCRTAIERAKEWIRTCEANHSCRQSETCFPTRLIDVGEAPPSKSVKLVETVKGQMGRYIALSHSWGLSHRIKTTKTTIQDHKRDIRLSMLPKTFQDAIFCARKLRIRWVWIDTLCIIQDDEEDWIAEAAAMGDVYSNAYLTISASASTDDSSGIFPSMDERLHEIPFKAADAHCHGPPGPLNVIPELNYMESRQAEGFALSPESTLIPYESAGGVALVFLSPEWMPSSTRASMVKYQVGEFGMYYDPLDGEPLSKRGWTYQERLLSHRVLHYASDQMYFECLEGITAEDGASFPPWSRRMPQLKDLPINELSRVLATSLLVGNSEGVSPSEGSNRKGWSMAWMKLVEDYSPRVLTRADDKLPAVGGLANAISRLTGAQYLAGHWDSMLLETLAWQVKSVEHIFNASGRKNEHSSNIPWKSVVSSPENYRAPSWSWASVDAEVNFSYVKKVTASVIDWHVGTAPGDRFGKVTSSWIKLRVSH